MVMAVRACNISQWSGVTPLDAASSWQVAALQTVNHLATLPDNWDGYGSPKIQHAARQSAAELIAILALQEPPAPHIAPVPGGGLQLEWEFEGRELELEVLPNGSLEFLVTGETGAMVESIIKDRRRVVPMLINWLKTARF